MIRRSLSGLHRDRRGVTIVEFAIVAPVMILMLMGLFDIGYRMYAQSILSGAVQEAGRDSTIGDVDTANIDTSVITMIGRLINNPVQNCGSPTPGAATWCSTRRNYANYQSSQPEPYTDANSNGKYDSGECFTDLNGNGNYDTDLGADGPGTANQVVGYTMTITYPRQFPMAGLLGWPTMQSISASTLLKNQPLTGSAVAVPLQVCPKK